MAIEDALAPWLGNQRWFAGKGQGTRDLAIVADTELVAGDPELRHLIIAVSHGTTVDYYQILVGLRRRLPARLKHVRIGSVGDGPAGGGRIAYDALHDAELTKPLLAAIPRGGVAWLLAGGIMYTAGIVFYASKRIRFGHVIWHVFVMAGSACHYVAVLLVVLPRMKH